MKTIIVIISKNKSKNEKNLMNKMCLELNFTYAVQILLRSVNKYVTSREAVTSLYKILYKTIEIIEKIKYKINHEG